MNNVLKIQKFMKDRRVDAFLITNLKNVRYLSGFSGSSGCLIILKNKSYILTDFRYFEQVEKEVSKDFELFKLKGKGLIVESADLMKKHKIKKFWFESDSITFTQYKLLLKEKCGKMHGISHIIERFRMYKTKDEIKAIKKACYLADRSFLKLLKVLKIGMTEKEIASELVYLFLKEGAEKESFDPIVASGPNSSIPHHMPTNRKIRKGDFLKIDFGVYLNGYASDMTRTIFIGKPAEKQKRIYNIVKDAQQAAFNVIKPGVLCSDVDKAARELISKAGFKDNFGHGLGHGLGLEVHEWPAFAPSANIEAAEGMVLSVEPGIYIADFGGVRIEDLIAVTKNGYENLTCQKDFSHKNIIVI